jgi:ribose 5-phosphate isomerase B
LGAVRIAFGTDEQTTLTDAVVERLRSAGHEVDVVAEGAEWPEVGRAVAEAVVAGRAARGVVCCTTGTGVAMAANKVAGARAALCTDAATAEGARRWNDANVLAFGLRLTSQAVATEMLERFLSTPLDPAEGSAVARVEPPDRGDDTTTSSASPRG